VNGLTWDDTTATLYGTTSLNDPSFTGLIRIDTTTGAGTSIGTGWGGLVSVVTNITADSAGNLFAWTEDSDDLVAIDKLLGTASVVGSSGIGTARYGLAFDAGDNLWLVQFGTVYLVDALTGAASTSFSYPNAGEAHHGDFDPDTGFYVGVSTAGAGPKSLDVVDFVSEAEVATLPTVNDLHTLAFRPTSDDGTPPVVSCSIARRLLWLPFRGMSVVGLAYTATDDQDPEPAVTVEVWSDEPDTAPLGDALLDPIYGLRLRAQTTTPSGGRVYLVIVRATDAAGNVGVGACTVFIPWIPTGYWISLGYAQAAQADDAFAQSQMPPPGWFPILAPTAGN
jgi:hypothetical protein